MPDIRNVRTVNAIREAFEQLIIEQGDVYFTIKEIAGKADINRKTFYLHYNCLEDLFIDLENRTEEKLIEILDSHNFFNEKFSLTVFLDSIIELIDSNPRLYERLLVDDKFKFLFRGVKDKIKGMIIPHFMGDSKQLVAEMEVEYVFSGLMKMFRVWQKHKDEMTIMQMREVAYSIIKYGIINIEDERRNLKNI